MNFINLFGLLMAIAILFPNFKHPLPKIERTPFFDILVQIGLFGGLFTLSFNIGLLEKEYFYGELFWLWLPLGVLLTLGYVLCHYKFRKKPIPFARVGINLFPFLLFLSTGLMLGHFLTVGFSVIYAVGCIPDIFRSEKKEKNKNENQMIQDTIDKGDKHDQRKS